MLRYKPYTAGSENTMMFNIKIKERKLLHSYPEINFAKSKCWMFFFISHAQPHADTHTHAHTKVHTEEAGYLQLKMANVQQGKTHQTESVAERLRASELKNNGPTSSLPKFASSRRT